MQPTFYTILVNFYIENLDFERNFAPNCVLISGPEPSQTHYSYIYLICRKTYNTLMNIDNDCLRAILKIVEY